MEKDGRIIDRDWSNYHTSNVVFQPANMTVKELQDGYNWIFRQTYSTKNILSRVFRSMQGIPYRTAVNISYRRKAMQTPTSPMNARSMFPIVHKIDEELELKHHDRRLA
jgi:hypothetical protein